MHPTTITVPYLSTPPPTSFLSPSHSSLTKRGKDDRRVENSRNYHLTAWEPEKKGVEGGPLFSQQQQHPFSGFERKESVLPPSPALLPSFLPSFLPPSIQFPERRFVQSLFGHVRGGRVVGRRAEDLESASGNDMICQHGNIRGLVAGVCLGPFLQSESSEWPPVAAPTPPLVGRSFYNDPAHSTIMGFSGIHSDYLFILSTYVVHVLHPCGSI